MPEFDSTDSANSDEDAAWRDLIARFDAPVATEEPVPWPERENASLPQDAGSGPASGPGSGSGPVVLSEQASQAPASPPPVWRGPSDAMDPADEVPDELPITDPARPWDPLTKAAWVALFGGPGYLFIATTANWQIPAVATFCAVAAFVAGVALLVFRLSDSDPSDGDDGAVV